MSLQFFVADDGDHGAELWVTDGTQGGTILLKDINPGLAGSSVSNLVQANGIMYFTAYDGEGTHLWRSDGTPEGTYALTSSTNGDSSSSLINVNGTLFFLGSDSTHGSGLFKTDGTLAGTEFVASVANASQMTAVGDRLFFSAYSPSQGYELWTSDGTAGGTVIVSDINPGSASASLGNYSPLNGKLFFTANDGAHGAEVWVSDGTAAGTFQIRDINLGVSDSGAGNFFAAAGHMFFTANDGAHGTQLWVSDGTSAGTRVLNSPLPYNGAKTVFRQAFYFVGNDVALGGSAIYSSDGTTVTKLAHLNGFSGQFFNLGSTLAFYGDDGTNGSGLYTFDGTNVAFASSVSGGFAQPVVSAGKLFFVSGDAAHGRELWVSDGTAAGTHLVSDVNPGTYDASIANISAVNGGVVFSAFRPDVGTELFFSDGTAAGTGLLSNANPSANHNPSLGFSAPVQAGGLGYFAADDGTFGNELWVTDGTSAGTHQVEDRVTGSNGTNPQGFVSAGGKIFFTMDDGVNGRQVYTSNGTAGGTIQLTSNAANDRPVNNYFFVLNDTFYFVGYDDAAGKYAIYTSDGTEAGTHKVVTLSDYVYSPVQTGTGVIFYQYGGTNGRGLYSFDGTNYGFVANVTDYQNAVVSGSKLFWHSNDGGHGSELWVSDGTAAGTHAAADINPGSYDADPRNITSLGNGSVVFTAFNPSTGAEVYVSDGTPGGTHVFDVNATGNHGQSLGFSAPVQAGGLGYFAADDGTFGNELWVTDGTSAGTHQVEDRVTGSNGTNPQGFVSAGGKIFFTMDDGINGRQVYTSNGTAGGTIQLTSNAANDRPVNNYFFVLNDTFYFVGYDDAAGKYAIYTSDGTEAGTRKVVTLSDYVYSPVETGTGVIFYQYSGTDGRGLYSFDGTNYSFVANVIDYQNAVVSGSKLFWHSNDGGNGSELWVSDGTAAGTHAAADINPGSYDADPRNITSLGNGSVVFTAFNPSTGAEVYVSDGTPGGTHVFDVNATGNHGQSLNFSAPVQAGGLGYFAADDGTFGNELWVTNGTTAGTHQVEDRVTGSNGTNPQGFVSAGGKIFFTMDDGVNGRQLYTSNGTAAGTIQLTSNAANDRPVSNYFFVLNDTFYFVGYDDAAGKYALYTSNGTLAGTYEVMLFAEYPYYPVQSGNSIIFYQFGGTSGRGLYSFDGANYSFVASVSDYENPVVSGDKLFWRSYDGGNGSELWVSNGTPASTHSVDINPAGDSHPEQISSLANGSVIFTADDGVHGREIYVSDGTVGGTTMLADLFPDGQGSDPQGLTSVGNKVFFTANYFSSADGAHGRELFVTDGTAAGTKLVIELTPDSGSTSFAATYAQNGSFYFTAYGPSGWQLYATDGSRAGTHAVVTSDGIGSGYAGNFIKADATHFYFTGNSGLYYSDGTNAGTTLVGSNPGFDVNQAAMINGELYFRRYDGVNGYELWKTDGTAAHTVQVTDTLIPNGSSAGNFVFAGGKVFFTADDGVHGGELWVTDGTSAGTHIVVDLNAGSGGTSFAASYAQNGSFYFTAYGPSGWQLYATDGTEAGTRVLATNNGIASGYAGDFIKADATHFYFTGDAGLYYSDGTNAGTTLVGSSSGFDVNQAAMINGELFFRRYDGVNGYELWKTDGTAANTVQVTDTLIPNGSNAGNFVFAGGKVFFTADDGVHGGELWVTDGTSAGTHIVVDLNVGSGGTSFRTFYAQNGGFYFTAYGPSGWQLYATDGTEAGTRVLATNDGIASGYAGDFIKADATHFYFTGDAGLYYSDGTNAATTLIGSTSGFDANTARVVNGELLFRRYDSVNGYELWKTNGTAEGTVRVTDTAIPNGSNPGSFAAVDNVPPTVTGVAHSDLTDQQTTHPFATTVIGDADTPVQTLAVTITPDDPARGSFTAASLVASGFAGGGAGGSYTFSGTPAQATAAIQALVFMPNEDRLVVGATETLTYTIAVNDGAGGSVRNAATTLTVASVNDAPTAASDSHSVLEDATAAAATRATGVLANDTDPDVRLSAVATGNLLVNGGAEAGASAHDFTESVAPQGWASSSGFTAINYAASGPGDLAAPADGGAHYFAGGPSNALSTATQTVDVSGYAGSIDSGKMLANLAGEFGGWQGQPDAMTMTATFLDGSGNVLGLTDAIGGMTADERGNASVLVGDAGSFPVPVGTRSIVVTLTATGTAGYNDGYADNVSLTLSSQTEAATLVVTGAHAGTGAATDTAVAASGTTVIAGTYGDLLIAADGTYRYTPNKIAAEQLPLNASASESFSYTVSDVHGATGTSVLTFNVTGQNDQPVAQQLLHYSATEAGGVANAIPGTGVGVNVLQMVADIDTGDLLQVTAIRDGTGSRTVGSPLVGAWGTTTIQSGGSLTFSVDEHMADALAQDEVQQISFTYTAVDGKGGSVDVDYLVDIHGSNDAPVATEEARSLDENGSVSGPLRSDGLLANDTDVDHGETVTLVVQGARLQGAATDVAVASSGPTAIEGVYGTLILGADGTYTYSANKAAAEALPEGAPVTESFNYTVADVHGATAVATITFAITGREDGPVAVANTASVDENASIVAATRAAGLLGNDTDVDTGEQATLVVTVAHAGSGADIAVATGTVLHGAYGDLTLNADGTYAYLSSGAAADALVLGSMVDDVFSYTIRDAQNVTSTSTLTIHVAGRNDLPDPAADQANVQEDATASAATRATGLLANDTDKDSGETARLVITAAHAGSSADVAVAASGTTTITGTYGDLIVAADGTYSYTPNKPAAEALASGAQVTETFTYTATDPNGGAATSTVAFHITGQNDAPTFTTAGGALSYVENDANVLLAPDVALTDDNVSFANGTLTVALTSGFTSGDQITLSVSPNPATGLSVDAQGVVSYAGTAFAQVVIGATSATAYFAPTATAAQIEALTEAVGYRSLSDDPGSTPRVFTFTLVDGAGTADGGTDTSSFTRTVNVTPVDDPAVAINDTGSVNENGTITGGPLFTNDTDVDGPALAVASVNGRASFVDHQIVLASGALLTVHANGTYDYDPNAVFNYLTDGSRGTANTMATDSFTYALANGGTANVTITIHGVDSPDDQATGSSGNDNVTGSGGADMFDLSQGGDDTASGGEGNDDFYFGAALTAADHIDGGAGSNDEVDLEGDYSGTNTLVLGANTLVGIELLVAMPGHDYSIKTDEGTVAGGDLMKVYGGQLGKGDSFTFDGSAETEGGRFLVVGGYGENHFTGGTGNDVFVFGPGNFGAGDTIDGGAGIDRLRLDGNYVVTIGGEVTNVEEVELVVGPTGSPDRYQITTADGLVAAGKTVTFLGGNVVTNMLIDGHAEADGSFIFYGGHANDTLHGGAGNDVFHGSEGADAMYGHGGSNTFAYDDVGQSTASSRDRIMDFHLGDMLDLHGIDANTTATGDQAFSWIGDAAFGNHAGELRIETVSASTFLVQGDTDGDGVADFVVQITVTDAHPITTADLVL